MEVWAFPADRRSGEVGGAVVAAEGVVPSATGTVVFLNGDPELQVILPRTAIGMEAGDFAKIAGTEGNTVGPHSLEWDFQPLVGFLKHPDSSAPRRALGWSCPGAGTTPIGGLS